MGAIQTIAVESAPAAGPDEHLLSVDEFLTLDDKGAFEQFAKAELIGGRIYTLNAMHRAHGRVTARLTTLLQVAVDLAKASYEVCSPVSLRLGGQSLPEPDILVAVPASGNGFAAISDTRLVVEVSDSTLQFDLTTKAELYAREGVPEYWVVDVAGGRIHQMTGSDGTAYCDRRAYSFGETIRCIAAPEISVDTKPLA